MKVIIDFDNTFYTKNRDIDDALALFYLLGSPNVEVVGIISTFGNSHIERVHRDTLKLLKTIGIEHIPYAKGACEAGDYLTAGSSLLAELVRENQGDITILATGSMTNLHGAYLQYPQFYEQIKQIVIMGGTTKPLMFAKQEMLELNLSVDPLASFAVLTKGYNVNIMTGNNCLDLLFTKEQYKQMFNNKSKPIVNLIQEHSDKWFVDNQLEYGINGFYNWDTLAAAYLINPEFFEDQISSYQVSINSLSTGSLIAKDYDSSSYANVRPNKSTLLNLPRIKHKEELTKHIYDTWLNVSLNTKTLHRTY